MTEPFDDSVAAITRALQERSLVYTDAQPDEIQALGSSLALAAGGDPGVARQLGYLAALMALEPDAFYEAAELRTKKLLGDVRRMRATITRIFEGPDGILRWSPSSLGLSRLINAAKLEELLSTIRKVRFARSNVTEEVHADLILKAQLAQRELAELRQQTEVRAANIATTQVLDALRDAVYSIERGIYTVTSLPGQWSQVGWREFALRRVLEHLDVDITRDLLGIELLPTSDAPLDAAIAHTALGIELMERLLTVRLPFGDLLSPDVVLTPDRANKTRDIRLRPIPEVIKGRRTFSGHVGGGGTLQTCVLSSGDWDHPTWFEQEIVLNQTPQSGGWMTLGTVDALHEILMMSSTAGLSLTADGGPLPNSTYIAQFALISYATGVAINHSSTAALASQMYITESVTLPFEDTFCCIGDQGGPRFKITTVAGAPTTIAGISGSYRLLTLSDPEGDTPSGSAAYLLGLTISDSTMELRITSNSQGLTFGTMPMHSLDVIDPSALMARFQAHAPESSYHGGIFGLEVDKEIRGDLLDDYPSVAIFTTAWPPAEPYMDTGWSADAVLYVDKDVAMVTRSLRLVSSMSPEAKALLANALLRNAVRLVDPLRVQDPVVLSVQRAFVATEEAPTTTVDFYEIDDLVLQLSEAIDSTVDWELQLQATPGGLADHAWGFEALAITPWRGWSNLGLDLAPGDLLYTDDDQRCIVWTTSGSRIRVIPPLEVSGPSATLNALRVRYINRGDRVVTLSDTEGETGAWKVETIDYTGVTLRGLSGVTTLDAYHVPMAVTKDTGTTHRFEAIEVDSATVVNLEELERKFIAQLAREITLDPGTITPLQWYLVVAGRTEPSTLRDFFRVTTRSLSRPLPSTPIPAQFSVRARSDGYGGTLELVEVWEFPDGTPRGAIAAGNSQVYDLLRNVMGTIETLRLPATASPPEAPELTPVRTLTQFRGSIRGPLTRMGTPSFPPWGLMTYRLERRALPDFQELFRDIGRARATVGTPRQVVQGQTGLSLEILPGRSTGTLTLASELQASRVEGCDVVFISGTEPDPPVRVASAVLVEGETLVMTVRFSRVIPESLSGTIELHEHTLAQAWREIRAFDRYMALLETWLQYPPTRTRNRVVETASRLRLSGHFKAAQAVLDCDFPRWVDPAWASADGRELVDKIDAVVTSLTRQRGGDQEG